MDHDGLRETGENMTRFKIATRAAGDLPPPSPPGEKTAARQDQAWQPRACDGPGTLLEIL